MQVKQEYTLVHIGGNGGIIPEGHPFYRVMAGIIKEQVQEKLDEQKNPIAATMGKTSSV